MKKPIISDNERIQEANRRLNIITTVRALMFPEDPQRTPPLSERKACKRVGVDQATFGRWRKRFEAEGYNGLLPETDACGRKSMLQVLKEQVGEDTLKLTLDKVQGLNLDTESNTAAWRSFAQSDQCPEEVARIILDPNKCSKHAIPPSLRAATKLTEPVRDAHRGRRQLDLNGIWIPRKIDILPGDIFTADDTTPIWGWWVPWTESKEYPHGVKLLQGQFLPVMDVASQCIITFVLIAREKSSYRAADVWALFGHTFETVGLPRLGWQLERGSWEANIIRGEEVLVEDGDLSYSRRVGGLRQLPTNITEWHNEKFRAEGALDPSTAWPKTLQTWTSYLPKSKSIEGAFNRMQTLEGTLWGALGRDQMRRPFEKTKKLFQACQRGTEDPRNHFLSHIEISKRLTDMLSYVNSEPMEGEVFFGVPRLKFDQALRDYPLYRLPDEQRWLYKRNWKVLPITSGWARVRLTHEISGQRYSLFYCNPAVFGQIEGAEVVVYYDRENFEAPAQIIAAKPVVVDGHRIEPGEFICEANYFERRGSFLEGDMSGHDVRKAWRNAVLSTYSTIVQHAPSRHITEEIAQRRKESAQERAADILSAEQTGSTESSRTTSREATNVPLQVDGRPTSQTPRVPTPQRPTATSSEQSEFLKRQAERARRLSEVQEQ